MPDEFDIPSWVSERGVPNGPTTSTGRTTSTPARTAWSGDDPPQTRRGLRAATGRGAAGRWPPELPNPEPPNPERRSREGGRHRPPGARHRGPSRRVRLHRTMAATATLVLLISGAAYLHARDSAAAQAGEPALTAGAAVPSTTPVRAESASPTTTSTPTPTPTPTPTVVQHGSGTFATVALPALANGAAPSGARVIRIGFQIEGGLGVDPASVAGRIAAALVDKRGWERRDRVRFQFVTAAQLARGEVDITVRLSSPDTTDKLCRPLSTNGYTSCFANHRAVLNVARWLTGVPFYKGHLDLYRTYMVNHEVGHGLGHGHVGCPATGAKAPTMLQQTLRLDGCVINPYPMVA